ncbi:hypothetical protein EZV62_019476 [Acer yangbiense]|uniref:BED-type domain-containing protein n=1 Tax=Acer yangbiense TaxID=1000413 RepID=A0A5C7HB07_9ROSI|nr:hypothetical protein EZV62_019476 [Acer yangbiense]
MAENSNATTVEPYEILTTDEALVATDAGTKRRPTKTPSKVWIHFTKNEGGNMCICNYCGKDYACGSKKVGTSTLWTHLNDQCKKYHNRLVDEKQKVLTFEKKYMGDGTGNLVAMRFSKDACRKALSKMIVLDELPFSFVEREGFRHFCFVACPKFDPPSQTTIARDINQFYLDEKGETIGKIIEACLLNWGIERVFTITVDNASANDVAVKYVKRKLSNWVTDGIILEGEFFHVRCCAHILNLIVGEGLKDIHESIISIRNAVRYVRSSPSRWNSTYLMLESALKFKKAFERLEEEDGNYVSYFLEDESGKRKIRPPRFDDWETSRVFVKFLKKFYDATLKFSASLSVTSNLYFHEVFSIQSELTELSTNTDPFLGTMATSMQRKYDKYWGSIESINKLLLISVVLDPRYKLDYVTFCLGHLYGNDKGEEMTKGLKELLCRLYECYNGRNSNSICTQSSNDFQLLNGMNVDKDKHDGDFRFAMLQKFKKMRETKDCIDTKNEVDRFSRHWL